MHSPTKKRRARDKSEHEETATEQVRGTHGLESTEGGRSQDTERKQPSEAHSLTGECRGRDKSDSTTNDAREGHPRTEGQRQGQLRTLKEGKERGALTSWRARREGQDRTRNERERTIGTHVLGAKRDDQFRKSSERGALTSWRA